MRECAARARLCQSVRTEACHAVFSEARVDMLLLMLLRGAEMLDSAACFVCHASFVMMPVFAMR